MARRRIGFATCEQYRELASGDWLAAELLEKRGCEVVPLVWTETSPTRVECDVVIIRSVWDYHLDVERFLGWVDEVAEGALVLNSPPTIRWNSDKRYLLEMHAAGVPIPRTVVFERGERLSLREKLDTYGSQSAVMKPVVSASAYKTYLVDRENVDATEGAVNEVLRSRSLLMQDFVPEIMSEGEWSLMFFGGKYSHAVRKLPQAGDFRVQAEHGGRHVMDSPSEEVIAVAEKVVSKFAADTLYARVDLVEAKAGPLIMELELIDPELFLDIETAERFAAALREMAG